MIISAYDCGLTRTKFTVIENGEIVKKGIISGLPEIASNSDSGGITAATGVYAAKTKAEFIIPEFEAAAAGLSKLSGESDFTAVILGTGTPFLRVNKGGYTHIGGTGVGGGTITGLGGLLCGETDFDKLYALSKSGDSGKIDLMLRDISDTTSKLLPENVTACNFGKNKTEASAADKAAAIFTLVLQTVFVMAVLAANGNEKIVVGGGLSKIPEAALIATQIGEMHGKSFIFPKEREFANCIGAAICAAKK